MKRIIIAAAAALAAGTMLAGTAQAQNFLAEDTPPPLRTETFSVEPTVGYVAATTREYVRDPSSGSKISQLNWNLTGLAVGGRVAFKPLDWVTVRVRGWTLASSNATMRDYDWLYGYTGFNSYTHVSVHPDTTVPTAWFADASAAFTYWQDSDVALNVSAGFRHYETKYDARGGQYQYTDPFGRIYSGIFTPGKVGLTYSQEFNAPYVGLGVAYAAGDWTLSGEIFGSPFVFAKDDDQHRLRDLHFKSKFDMSSMVGLNGATEYRWTDTFSTVARVEYQHFMEARGSATGIDTLTGRTVNYLPKPGAGTDADTVLLSFGIKARL